VAVGQGPWHSANSDIYHDNPNCQTGSSIDPENIRQGTTPALHTKAQRGSPGCSRYRRSAPS
jgi:hypothetical protein